MLALLLTTFRLDVKADEAHNGECLLRSKVEVISAMLFEPVDVAGRKDIGDESFRNSGGDFNAGETEALEVVLLLAVSTVGE